MKKKKFFIVLAIIAIIGMIGLAVVVYIENTKKAAKYTPPMLNAPIEIPDTGIVKYKDITDFEKPAAVLFYVDWCTYCRRFMPVFGEISKTYKDKYTFSVVNCDYPENRKMVEDFHIMGFPTVYIIDKKYDYTTGINSFATSKKEFLTDELDKYYKLRSRIK